MSASTATGWAEKAIIPKECNVKWLTAYYDFGRKDYLIKNHDEEWIAVTEGSARRQLVRVGVVAKRNEGELQSAVDKCLTDIQLDDCVAYAGPLAGYTQGIKTVCGQKILVTTSPKLIEPKAGDSKVLDDLIHRILGEEQSPYFLGWLKVAYESLCAEHLRPGQVLVLAGKRNSGKSLLQNIITEILGGRVAKPYRYMSGAPDFNGDLIGSEHLAIEDEIASTDIRARLAFGARIKDFTVNQVQSCHHKGRAAISLAPFWRVSVSVNDEPENLQILPPFDESIGDKILLFRANKSEMPMPTQTNEQLTAFWTALVSSIPSFLFNLGQWEIPQDLECERFGIKHYHHPELLEELSEMVPEMKLLRLTDDYLTNNPKQTQQEPFTVTADELERELTICYGHQAQRLFTWPSACGTYLARLENKFKHRVRNRRGATARVWEISYPDTPRAEVTA